MGKWRLHKGRVMLSYWYRTRRIDRKRVAAASDIVSPCRLFVDDSNTFNAWPGMLDAEYFAVYDDDDLIFPAVMNECLYRLVSEPALSCCYSLERRVEVDTGRSSIAQHNLMGNDFLERDGLHHGAVIRVSRVPSEVRNACFEHPILWDWLPFAYLALTAGAHVPKVGYEWRIRRGSHSTLPETARKYQLARTAANSILVPLI